LLKVFTGNSNPQFAHGICRHLQIPLGKAIVDEFKDGEIKVELNEDIRDSSVFIVQSTNPPGDNLLELLIMIDAAKRASAKQVVAVIPYFGYARQDRKDRSRVPISARLIADLIETAGADRVLVMDLHTNQIQGFFKIPVDCLYADVALVPKLKEILQPNTVLLAPDSSSVKFTAKHRKHLDLSLAWIHKERDGDGNSEVLELMGNVYNKNIVIIDDMIDTGGTMVKAIIKAKANGAKRVIVAATHGIFSNGTDQLRNAGVQHIITTNTHPNAFDFKDVDKIDASFVFSEAISRIYEGKSVSDLFLI